MAAMEEGKINLVVKLKWEQRKKDEPLKLRTDLPASMTFQQLLKRIVPDISHITATCRVGFKKHGEQIPTVLCSYLKVKASGKLQEELGRNE